MTRLKIVHITRTEIESKNVILNTNKTLACKHNSIDSLRHSSSYRQRFTTPQNSALCPHMHSMHFSQQTVNISINSTDFPIFAVQMQCSVRGTKLITKYYLNQLQTSQAVPRLRRLVNSRLCHGSGR